MDEPTPDTRPSLTSALEDYLETIYELVRKQSFARVRDIARARGVKAGSVSPALKRLADLGLVDYARREYITLTEAGEHEARRVYARHRLLSQFFEHVLQMPHDAADSEACAMEHSLSDEGMDRLVRFFEFLGACPNSEPSFLERFHGCSLVHAEQETCEHACHADDESRRGAHGTAKSVYDLDPGQGGQVTQVNAEGAIRQRLLDMGILPQARVDVERVAPAGEPIWIRLHGTQLALRRQEAEAVMVAAA
jgi:DtxR family transcriptional regulator, Mn-dependent transcriptional regulator